MALKLKEKIDDDVKNWIDKARAESYSLTEIESWKLFYNKYNPSNYSYLTELSYINKKNNQKEVFKYPAKFRWIPIVKKNLKVLISTQELRPFIYNISASDQASVERKFHAQTMGMVEYIFGTYKKFDSEYVAQLRNIESQKQQFEEMLSKEPENQQEAIQQKQIMLQMPYINAQIDNIKSVIQNKQIVTTEQLSKVKAYFDYEAKDFMEETAINIALKIMKENKFKSESNKAFTSRLVTGRPMYYVNHDTGDKNVSVRYINEMDVIYPAIGNIEWTCDLPWIILKERYSHSDVVRIYGHLLSSKQVKDLKQAATTSPMNPVFISTPPDKDNPGGGAVLTDKFSYGGTAESETVEVLKIWYKTERVLYARVSPNKHNQFRPHIHFVDEENIKLNPERKDKGERIEKRYISERNYGVVINGNIFLGFEKDDMQPRDSNNLSKVYLPIVGKVNASINQQASSVVQDTKDLNELYQIINYHKELYVATSGIQGQIIDLSQKPADMSLAEHRYHRKMGSLFIQTRSKTGKALGGSYNQWKSYDDSISSSVQFLDTMLENIDQTMGIIMGVPRQRVGQTLSTDQVGSNEQAAHMANLVTETLHYEQDEQDAKALEMAVNIHMNYLLKPGEIISIPNDEMMGETIFKVPEFDNLNSQIKIHIQNNKKQFEAKQKIEQAAISEYQKGTIPFHILTTIFNTENIKKIEKKLEQFSKDAQKARELAEQNAYEAENQKEKLKQQVDMTLKQMEIDAKMAELEITKYKIEREAGLKEKEIDINKNIEVMKMATERETEATYLQEQNRASTIDEQLAFLRLQLDAMVAQQQLEIDNKDVDNKKTVALKKAAESSTKKKVKERVKD